ncbi:MAG: YpdA family putative bacillithiol disulfide reductase [Acidobacteriia bacterium]|nr:YpdA family putative bacillithiol disulfide reductase [Terriglobia bacterium]
MAETHFDVGIVGAGPAGLACAIECERRNLSCLVFDKGCLVNSLAHYPVNMVFFTTPELLEIGDLPLVCAREKPSRLEGLKYYRRVAETYALNIHQYERVLGIEGSDGKFVIKAGNRLGQEASYAARKIVVATGYYDNPNVLEIAGEDLPKVSHYYMEAHPYFNQDVAVIGGKNSAIEAALELYRSGARVTLIYRGSELGGSIKYWIKPDIENRIRNNEIAAHFNTRVLEIAPDSILIEDSRGRARLKNDFVFALTGYHPDRTFLQTLGIDLDPEDWKPKMHPETFETNVPGIYMAGSVVAGLKNNEIFIENGRFHGKAIAQHLKNHL